MAFLPEETSAAPFHEGESLIQQRVGVRDHADSFGKLAIRDFMPEQHRTFFAQLPFVITGGVDGRGQAWASVLANPPGFIASPDPRHLLVGALPRGFDPLSENLLPGAAIAFLGIEPHTRRRNRMNGVVEEVAKEGFLVRVRQSFGNCPKYIQARRATYVRNENVTTPAVDILAELDEAARRLVTGADTFFIATAHPAARQDAAAAWGADVSHRGGRPGFVRVDGCDTLTVPDFSGNRLFNTLGNLVLNPQAGLLFIDFERGDLLYLATETEIIFDTAEVRSFAGAERLLRLRVRTARRVAAPLPLRWGEAEISPYLQHTGRWAVEGEAGPAPLPTHDAAKSGLTVPANPNQGIRS